MTSMSVAAGQPELPYPHPISTVPEEAIPSPINEGTEAETARQDEPHIQVFSSDDLLYGDQVKWASQRLHTEVYLENGYIRENDVNEFGIYMDPYVDRSTYFFIKNGLKVAAARQIHCSKKEGMLSLPTAKEFEIDPEAIKDVAGVEKIADLRHDQVAEISALASRKVEGGMAGDLDAVMTLYAELLRTSLEKGHKLWLMNIDPKFAKRLSTLVGEGQIRQLGPERAYMGPPTIPVAANPQEVIRKILEFSNPTDEANRKYLQAIFDGMDSRKLPADIRSSLQENGINFAKSSVASRVVHDKELLFQAGIVAYSAARALPVNEVQEFHGSTAALWGIDVATAVPYAKGMIAMYTGKSLGRKALGAAVALPSFLAPYAYLYAEGHGYPPVVNAAVGAFAGSAVLKEVLSRRSRRRRETKIEEALSTAPS